MFKKGRIAAIIVIALILSVTTYAFAAANTVPDTAAGDGTGAISGYAISAVKYTISGSDITGVAFTATLIGSNPPAATPTFYAQITGTSSSSLVPCTGTLPSLTCTGSFGTIANATGLRVVAYN